MRTIISTPNAPQAVGTYSQAVRCGSTVYVSGQIPLDPATGQLVEGSMELQIRRVFDNLKAIVVAAGGDLSQVAKLNVFLTDLAHFALLNQIMADYFKQPYPARAAVQVAALPKGAAVEMDCVVEM
jgi:reactive intermediate/imine deaminase